MKLCECGCGGPAPIATKTNTRFGHKKGEPMRFICGHNPGRRGERHHNWSGGRTRTPSGYVLIKAPENARANSKGYVLEHLVVAERALGKPVPLTAEVHHVNGQKDDNRPENLVVCQDRAYHALLEQRTRALKESGHADWLRCSFCQTYDDPRKLFVSQRHGTTYHRRCQRVYQRGQRAKRKVSHASTIFLARPEVLPDRSTDIGEGS